MSGDVQPRKRKEKRRKKEDSEEIPTSFSSDEQLHVHKDASTGGNICAKILFFLLSFVLLVMIGLVLFEYRGSADDETLVPVSKWAPTFDGWLETPVKHDEHADITESGEQERGESEEHENESAEGEGHLSEEAASKEEEEEEEKDDDDDEEEGGKESEEEETKSVEEEEEDDDEEADKLKDEESEEVDENEIEDRDESEEQEEEQEEEASEEDAYEHGKSEEDIETDQDDVDDDVDDNDDDDDDDVDREEEDEDAESGREELDDDDEEREVPVYQRESDEIDDLLRDIPGITESDEDEEGDNLGRSDEIIDKLKKIPGVNEKKIKEVSEEEADVPRRKQEEEVSESTQPMEGTSTVIVEQKPQEQQKTQDQSQAKLKDHQAAVELKSVTEKPTVVKNEKPETLPPQDQHASKRKHKTSSTEHSAVKNDGFPSGPGETGQGQKSKDVTTPASKGTPSKKQKVRPKTTEDGTSEATPTKKQKDDTGPASKSEPLAADPPKPIVSGGKNVKDKDVSADGVHSAPKASRIGDKIEHSPKGGKPGTSHKVTEQSSPTKVDTSDRIHVSESHHVGKSKEEHKKTMESKDQQGSKSVHTTASDVKNSKYGTKGAQTPTEETVKISDLKTNMHDKLGGAGNSGSVDKKVKTASNGKEKETVLVDHGTKESENLNSRDKQVKGGRSTGGKKLAEKKEENLNKNGHPPNQEKKKDEQSTRKLGGHAESISRVTAKDSKVHDDSSKSKVDIEKQKAASPASEKIPGGGSSEAPVKVSVDKARKANVVNTNNKPPEKSADVNVARKKSGNDNTPPEDKHHSKARDTKTSAILETSSEHSVRKEKDNSKTQKVQPNVQNVSNKKNQDEVVKPRPASENRVGHQENSGNTKPVNPNTKKPSHGQKNSVKQTEPEVIQPEIEGSAKREAVPSRGDSDSKMVK